jgi:hypothetical protein
MYCLWLPENSRANLQQKHPFHLVEPSPLPFSIALSLGLLANQVVFLFQAGPLSVFLFTGWFFFSLWALSLWFSAILEEAAEGHHNVVVVQGLKYGMLLFIVSEVMFFFSFFFAYFYYSLSPSI